MAKTCENCKKRTATCRLEKNGHITKTWFLCPITGKEHEGDYRCDVPEKPRLCEVLGVDVGERFRVYSDDGDGPLDFYINDNGSLCQTESGSRNIGIYWLIQAINHPEKIERVPRLTPEEVQRCRDFGAKWVGRQKGIMADDVPPEDIFVLLFSDRPKVDEDGPISEKNVFIGAVRPSLFPSVRPGDLIPVEDEPPKGAEGK